MPKSTYLLVCLLFFVAAVFGAPTQIPLPEELDKYFSVAPHAFILEDENHALSLQDVMNRHDFTPINQNLPNLDFTTSTYWIKFELENTSASTRNFILETARPLTNVANLFVLKNGQLSTFKNGDAIPFSERAVANRNILFDLKFQPYESMEFYLQLTSDGEMLVAPIKLWVPNEHSNIDYRDQFINGGYFGTLILAIIIYFFFYIALKDISFKYYVLYIIGLVALQFSLDGYTTQYIFPDSPWFANHSVLLSASLAVYFVIRYAYEFIKVEDRLPKMAKVLRWFMIISILLGVTSLFDGPTYALMFPLINAASLIATLLILFTIFRAMHKGYHIPRLFAAAFFFLIFGAVLFILGNFSVIESEFVTKNAIKFGSACEVIFLALTMASKFRDTQLEKEKIQAKNLQQLKELNKLKDEANEKLEQQVKERTAKIEQQKEILAEKNHEIMDSINYAEGIQMSILPKDFFIKSYLPNSFVLFRPKDIVSGDFYWFTHKDGYTYFTAADCTGHGVPGAFVSMVGSNGLNRAVNQFDLTKPSEILDKVKVLVEETFEERKDGMDIGLCRLDADLKLQYAGAHNPLWIVCTKESYAKKVFGEQTITSTLELPEYENLILLEVKADKQPVGKFDHYKPFTNHEIQLSKGDRIYVFSDGYPDQFGGPKGKKFMSKRLKKVLLRNHIMNMEEQKEFLNQRIIDWMKEGKTEQIDDICMFGVEV